MNRFIIILLWIEIFNEVIQERLMPKSKSLTKDELAEVAARIGVGTVPDTKPQIETAIRAALEKSGESPRYTFGQVLRANGKAIAQEVLPVQVRNVMGIE